MTSDDAPTLMVHGDKDVLVPIKHSKHMEPLFDKAKVPAKLVTIEGGGHGITPEQTRDMMSPAVLEWFEKHLVAK